MADRVTKKGGIIVAAVVLAAVALAVFLTFARDDMRSTPVEDAVAGREITPATADPTDSDPLVSDNEEARPQGRLAPDSNEGVGGAGSPETTRDTPALNPGTAPDATPRSGDTGRNAPADPNNTAAQRVPENDLESGANADREESARIPR
jgi:hypothetical protein